MTKSPARKRGSAASDPVNNSRDRAGYVKLALTTGLVTVLVAGSLMLGLRVLDLRANEPNEVDATQLKTEVLQLRAKELALVDAVLFEVESNLSTANQGGALDDLLVQMHQTQSQEKNKLADLQRAEENNFRQVLIPALREELQGLRDQLDKAHQALDNSAARELNLEIERVNKELEAVHKDGLEAAQKIHQEQRQELNLRQQQQRDIIHRLRESLHLGDEAIGAAILDAEAVFEEILANAEPREISMRVQLDPTMVPTPKVLHRNFTPYGTGDPLQEIWKGEAGKRAGIALGKALFWDMQLGSDNKVACATCHNGAGSDWRNVNQFAAGNPGNRMLAVSNYHTRPNNRLDEIVGTAGVIQRHFEGMNPPNEDVGTDPTEAELNQANTVAGTVGTRTRQVTGRQAPTVINAVLNDRQFWDGRANRYFNGQDIFGSQSPDAGLWISDGSGATKDTDFLMDNSSLASQAVGPPQSEVEMSWGPNGSRRWEQIGIKLLDARLVPLGLQRVATTDSVLGTLAQSSGKGLTMSYPKLIQEAFRSKFWDAPNGVTVDGTEYTQMEANFAFFFGVAVQEYEATLVSDQTKIDLHAAGLAELNEQELTGMKMFFSGSTKCSACHGTAAFTKATVEHVRREPTEFMAFPNMSGIVAYDNGFYNIGTIDQTDPSSDRGVGRTDLPFGPISLSILAEKGRTEQYAGLPASLPEGVQPAVVGAMKTPGLRNIELTAPYFHNGVYGELEDVVKFYARGGDFPSNPHLDPEIGPIGTLLKGGGERFDDEKVDALVAFLKALTDERVRYRQAPFDSPELFVANGHRIENGITVDNMVRLSETGANGSQTA
ncbi:MAG: cytochrome c peroxidase, partial [Pirellulaceae bacterium]